MRDIEAGSWNCHWATDRDTLNRLSAHHRANLWKQTTFNAHIHTYRQFSHQLTVGGNQRKLTQAQVESPHRNPPRQPVWQVIHASTSITHPNHWLNSQWLSGIVGNTGSEFRQGRWMHGIKKTMSMVLLHLFSICTLWVQKSHRSVILWYGEKVICVYF